MAHGVAVPLFVLGVFLKGLTALIQTQQTVVAAVGEEAHLTCQLTQSKDVVQVTWQKTVQDGEINFATYNKIFGPKVNPNFTDRVEIKDGELQNSSIVIRELMEQDEGCYLCLFNCYPDGALTGRTCLQLYELHEPILHVRESDSAEESVVSCSATGRPAPTVTLTVTQLHLSHHNTVRVNNTNGTVTVTTTAELARSRDNSAQVGCAVRVLSVQKEVFLMIPELKQTSADGSDQKSGSDHRNYIGTIIVAVVCVAAVITITVWCKQNQKNSNIEMSETNQPTISITDVPQTPPVSQENSEIRKRTPPENSPMLSP
ncbi:OX-2 membrane glycoprotein isoform X2 [Lates calcarifer]|uniref:OX-2 membrane glycoprotein isoform X2 n=1 Tax=Lates calcarifer TaxID=8187 RepID=A0AAJ7VC74_LATCA|nr:OX-2 membrane glycoprotein isoform X2 [Lates calcarifer]